MKPKVKRVSLSSLLFRLLSKKVCKRMRISRKGQSRCHWVLHHNILSQPSMFAPIRCVPRISIQAPNLNRQFCTVSKKPIPSIQAARPVLAQRKFPQSTLFSRRTLLEERDDRALAARFLEHNSDVLRLMSEQPKDSNSILPSVLTPLDMYMIDALEGLTLL